MMVKLRFFRFTAVLALLCGIGGMTAIAQASPQFPTCQPMEFIPSGGATGYQLACFVGDWALTYKGTVPVGTSAATAQYSVHAKSAGAAGFVLNRSVRLPDPSMLGQVLVREAVVLDDGKLAVRDCPNVGCTLYRAIDQGSVPLKAAAVTVPVEAAQREEQLASTTQLVQSLTQEVRELKMKKADLEADVAALTQELGTAGDRHQEEVADLKQKVKQAQSAAQAKGQMSVADKETLARAARTENAERLLAQLQRAQESNNASEHAQQEKTAQAGEQAKQRADELATLREELAQVKALNADLTKTLAERDFAYSALEEKYTQTLGELKETVDNVFKVMDKYDQLTAELQAAKARLETAQQDAANLYVKLEASKLTQELSAQAATAAHLEVDSLNLQVAGLTAALESVKARAGVGDAAGAAATAASALAVNESVLAQEQDRAQGEASHEGQAQQAAPTLGSQAEAAQGVVASPVAQAQVVPTEVAAPGKAPVAATPPEQVHVSTNELGVTTITGRWGSLCDQVPACRAALHGGAN